MRDLPSTVEGRLDPSDVPPGYAIFVVLLDEDSGEVQQGGPRPFVATRKFDLGTFGPRLACGQIVYFDGHHVTAGGVTIEMPQLRGAITQGWLKQADTHRFEAREGTRRIGRYNLQVEAVEACQRDCAARGWAPSRYTLIGGDAPPEVPPGTCVRCGTTQNNAMRVHEDNTAVLWVCEGCHKNVCRECALWAPGTGMYFELTLCSHACWRKVGCPDE